MSCSPRQPWSRNPPPNAKGHSHRRNNTFCHWIDHSWSGEIQHLLPSLSPPDVDFHKSTKSKRGPKRICNDCLILTYFLQCRSVRRLILYKSLWEGLETEVVFSSCVWMHKRLLGFVTKLSNDIAGRSGLLILLKLRHWCATQWYAWVKHKLRKR